MKLNPRFSNYRAVETWADCPTCGKQRLTLPTGGMKCAAIVILWGMFCMAMGAAFGWAFLQ